MSPDGSWAVTVGDGAAVRAWDIERTSGEWDERESLSGQSGDVFAAEIDPAGRHLFTASESGGVIVYNMTRDGGFGAQYPGLGDRGIAGVPQIVEPGFLLA